MASKEQNKEQKKRLKICKECGIRHTGYESCGATGQEEATPWAKAGLPRGHPDK